MNKKAGIWIDHSKAVIVSLEQEQETVSVVESRAGRRVRVSGGSRTKSPYGPQDVNPEGRRYRKYMQQLKHFYERVCKKVGDAEAVYVFGPGPAKTEFRKHIESMKHTAPPITKIESAEKMSDAQLVARVRKHFRQAVRA